MTTTDFIEDIDEHISMREALEIKAQENLDKYGILRKLLDIKLRKLITNVKDNHTMDRLVYMAAWRDAYKYTFKEEIQMQGDVAEAFTDVDEFIGNIANEYAEWRTSIKGFRSKQIVEALSSDLEGLHNRRNAFSKLFTPSEKSA